MITIPDTAQIVALKSVQPDKTDKPGTRILLVDEVLRDSKSVQLIRVDCDSAKFYRVKFAPYQNAVGTTEPFPTMRRTLLRFIFRLCISALPFDVVIVHAW